MSSIHHVRKLVAMATSQLNFGVLSGHIENNDLIDEATSKLMEVESLLAKGARDGREEIEPPLAGGESTD